MQREDWRPLMTTKTTAAEVADQLKAAFPPATGADQRRLAITLFQALAEGQPVDDTRLAATVGRSPEEVSATLEGPAFRPLLYRDDDGRIIGFSGLGLGQLGETVHRLHVDGRELYAWCAGDALFLPSTLEREVRVESRCPVTGEPISLLVAPGGYRDIAPPEAVMSMLAPEEVAARLGRGEDVIQGLCHFLFFFASEEAAREWTSQHPGTVTFPIEDGFELGRRWIAHKWGVEPAGP
jgi:alkylmercury lyase